ncbi:MAG: HAD-IA family hydrolase [Burkholderiaceae bacterium]|nr:HAD-IA family hydrolase [Burkholderiaceae bacterium]
MTKQNFDLIVFDWDGTLMDSTAAIVKSIQASAQTLGLPMPDRETAAHVIGLGLNEAMKAAMPDADPAIYPRMAEQYRHYYPRFTQEITLFDGVMEMLEDLAGRGYAMAVATGKSRSGLNRVLRETGTGRFFRATRTVDETPSKPHPAMLQEITQELGEDMRRTVMIGDTTHDLLMASNAGAAGVAVQYGAHPAAELKRLNPLYTADSVASLHEWLRQNA